MTVHLKSSSYHRYVCTAYCACAVPTMPIYNYRLFVNLELSRIYTCFYISIVFAKNVFFFRIQLCIVTRPLYDVTMVDHMFAFKTDLEYFFILESFRLPI